MDFKRGLKDFVDEFGFYIFILFSTFVISLFEAVIPRRIYLGQLYSKALVLRQAWEEKLALSEEKLLDLKAVFGSPIFLIFLIFASICLAMFLIQVYRLLTLKPLIKRVNFSPSPLWSLKDFLKILVWVIFWLQVFSVSDELLGFFMKISTEREYIVFNLFNSFILDVTIFVLVLYWLKKYFKQGLAAIGVGLKNMLYPLKIALSSYLSFIPLLFIVMVLSLTFLGKYEKASSPQLLFFFLLFEKNPLILTLTSLFVVFIGPFVEELFFRGLLYTVLKKSIGGLQALLISSLLFAFLHMNIIGFFPILALAFLFVYLYEKTGSLWCPIFAHVLHNGFILLLIFLWRRYVGV
ncbi:MAG: type II CAAX endopeptidase family protein [Candidatus Kaelpia aquatica]|nr:type II CAAX endopeptidase family protein [Candidatus Kaelpia aquatica]